MMTDNTTLLKLMNEKHKPDYLYRQLAEECTELAHAALKNVRYMKHEMPLSQKGDVANNYLEELADVGVMLELAMLALRAQERENVHEIMETKRERMKYRLLQTPEITPIKGIEPSPSRLELSSDEVRKWAAFFNGIYGNSICKGETKQ